MTLEGIGLHTGAEVHVSIEPGEVGAGIVFVRTDLPGAPHVPARIDAVVSTDRATTLGVGGVCVRTVEHLLAALHALGRTDARVLLHGPELPILDGSALPWLPLVRALPEARTTAVRPRRSVVVEVGDVMACATPADEMSVEVEASFEPPIGRQHVCWDGRAESFETEVAPARTFAFEGEIETLRACGLAAGAAPGAGVLFGDDGPVVGGPLRFSDEPGRHKLLDAIGDLALLGAPLRAHVRIVRGGHAVVCRLVRGLHQCLEEPRP